MYLPLPKNRVKLIQTKKKTLFFILWYKLEVFYSPNDFLFNSCILPYSFAYFQKWYLLFRHLSFLNCNRFNIFIANAIHSFLEWKNETNSTWVNFNTFLEKTHLILSWFYSAKRFKIMHSNLIKNQNYQKCIKRSLNLSLLNVQLDLFAWY